ncbi:DUF5348 domain-containing protein [Bacillus salipaludis]|uniref:DUF5348 domain-containing protein n=1 Tax=Bacillus salipaludis TaxID=2547811 RepID=A0ABW8RL25_9BACI
MHCGELFELHLGDSRKQSCSMEIGRECFIIVGRNEIKFFLNQNEIY